MDIPHPKDSHIFTPDEVGSFVVSDAAKRTTAETRIEIRDHRNKAMFRVDDKYLNGYAHLCGKYATLTYLCLCRHADLQQESFPSVKTMAKKLGISRDSVMEGIKALIEWNIISKTRKRRTNQTWLCNTYTLLDKSVWKPEPSSTEPLGEPSRKTKQSQVQNGTQTKSLLATLRKHIKRRMHIRKDLSREAR